MKTTECFIGIDVSKESLEEALEGQEGIRSFANTPAGHAALVEYLKPMKPTLIVLEASGLNNICVTHQGFGWLDIIVHGRAAHGSAETSSTLA